jgi:hypothetical protein
LRLHQELPERNPDLLRRGIVGQSRILLAQRVVLDTLHGRNTLV